MEKGQYTQAPHESETVQEIIKVANVLIVLQTLYV